MTVIHANDPTTKVLSLLYEWRTDVTSHITESSTNGDVRRALRGDDTIMMLGHGNQSGLFSKPNSKGDYRRFLITDRHVQFLRNKTCIGIWCHANLFAEKYNLHGLFSGMIISELQEAIDYGISVTKEEIDLEMQRFTLRLKECIDGYGLNETPFRMREFFDVRSGKTERNDVQSELITFNYGHLYYY